MIGQFSSLKRRLGLCSFEGLGLGMYQVPCKVLLPEDFGVFHGFFKRHVTREASIIPNSAAGLMPKRVITRDMRIYHNTHFYESKLCFTQATKAMFFLELIADLQRRVDQ